MSDDRTVTATFSQVSANCPTSTICGTVVDGETGTFNLSGVLIQLFGSTSNLPLQQTRTDTLGHYSFAGLASGNYRARTLVPGGQNGVPSSNTVTPGSQTNFRVYGVPALVTVTTGGGPYSSAFFTRQPLLGGPPCVGGSGCPVSYSVSIRKLPRQADSAFGDVHGCHSVTLRVLIP